MTIRQQSADAPHVAQSPAPTLSQGEAVVRLQALTDQQVNTMRALVEYESKLANAEREVARTTGVEQQRMKEMVIDAEHQVVAYRAALTDLRLQIEALRGIVVEVPPTPPPSFPMVVEQERIFGYSKVEFVSMASMLVLLPLVVAFAVRIVRRSVRPAAPAPALESERFTRLEQAVESIAIEVERIGESQRFTSKVLTERAAPSVAPRFKPSVTPV